MKNEKIKLTNNFNSLLNDLKERNKILLRKIDEKNNLLRKINNNGNNNSVKKRKMIDVIMF
jgi:hypothetical protein